MKAVASEREVSSTEGGGSVSQEKRKAGFRGQRSELFLLQGRDRHMDVK